MFARIQTCTNRQLFFFCNKELPVSVLHISLGFDIYLGVVAFILGACMGSFLNCMAWRIANNESIFRGRSHCDECGKTLQVRDLFPLVSYLINKGKCRFCGAKLSAGHLVAELLTGAVFVLVLFTYDLTWQTLEMLLLCCILLVAAFTDIKNYTIPNGCIIAGIIFRIPFFFLLPNGQESLVDALLGGFAVGGGLLLVVLVYEKLRQIEAMGGGDLKLLFVTGLYLGWAQNILCLFLACILGIVFGLVTQKRREHNENAKIFPWGPSICAAAILCMLVGSNILDAYLALF